MSKIVLVYLFLICLVNITYADSLKLKNGNSVKCDGVWIEGNEYKCRMHGSIVGFPKKDVNKVVQDKPKETVQEDESNDLDRSEDTDQSVKTEEISNGTAFRDLSWGDSVQKDMTKIGTDSSHGGLIIYSRPSDSLIIGRAKLQDIAYYFWNNKLSNIKIITQDFVNFNGLKESLIIKYGEPIQENPYIEKYLWLSGEPSTGDTIIVLEYNEATKKGTLVMFSQSINDEQKAYDEDMATKGAGDL